MGEPRILIKDLKPILDQHEIEIKVLKKSKEDFKDHLKKHEDVYDKKLNNHNDILFGEKGDDGLVFDVKQIVQMKKNVSNLTWTVVAAIVIEIVLRFLK